MAKKKNRAEQYIDDVISEKINVCRFVNLAVQRHLDDLKTGIDRGLHFDRKEGEKWMAFSKLCKHTKGEHAGKSFELEPWEAFIVYTSHGWKRNVDGKTIRRFKRVYVEVPKKNGKTTLLAMLGIGHLIIDKEQRPEIYSVATSRAQARICFEEAQKMIEFSPDLQKYATVYAHNIHSDFNGGKFEPLSKDSGKVEGKGASFVINDEYHLQVDDSLYDNLRTGMAARLQPQIFSITTAGDNKEGPCFAHRKYCIDVLEGKIVDDQLFSIIYTLDEEDDWKDEKSWQKANPNYGVSVSPIALREEFNEAMNNESKVFPFKTKHLNLWVDAATVWIRDEDFQACNLGGDPEKLNGKSGFFGLDIASGVDINALSAVFERDDGSGILDLLLWFWIPEKKMIEKQDKVDYRLWAEKGYINIVPGNVIDFDYMGSQMLSILQKYKVNNIQIDPAKSTYGIVQILEKQGYEIISHRQGFISMDAPTKEYERLLISGKLNHCGNPVLRWMMGNAVIDKDAAGNIKVTKSKSFEKVDGVVSSIMAVSGWMAQKNAVDINEVYKNGF